MPFDMIALSVVATSGVLSSVANTEFILTKIKIAGYWISLQLYFPFHFEYPGSCLNIKAIRYTDERGQNFTVIVV